MCSECSPDTFHDWVVLAASGEEFQQRAAQSLLPRLILDSEQVEGFARREAHFQGAGTKSRRWWGGRIGKFRAAGGSLCRVETGPHRWLTGSGRPNSFQG